MRNGVLDGNIREFFGSTNELPSMASLVSPESGTEGLNRLRALSAKYWLKRLLLLCAELERRDSCRAAATATRDVLASIPRVEIEKLVLGPEMTSFVSIAGAQSSSGDGAGLEASVSSLENFLIPALVRSEARLKRPLRTRLSAGAHADLLDLGVRVRPAEDKISDRIDFSRAADGEVTLSAPGIGAESFPEALLKGSPGGRARGGRFSIEALPQIGAYPLVIADKHPWYGERFLQDPSGRAEPLHAAASSEEIEALRETLGTAVDIVRHNWNDGFLWLRQLIVRAACLRSKGVYSNAYTVVPYRGFVAFSVRPGYLAAQSLLHEAGHNRMNTILELFDLHESKRDLLIRSPFVDDARSPAGVFHGCMAFLQDILLTRRLIGKVPSLPGISPMEQYLEFLQPRVAMGIEVLRREVALTQHGEELVAAFEAALAGARP